MATGLTTLKCNTRQVREYLMDAIQVGLVPFVQSSPGMGKSTIINSIADYYNLQVLDTRLSTKAPEDLSGLPSFIDVPVYNDSNEIIGTRKKASFIPFENFPVEGDPLPKGKDGWMIFFDEFNSGSKAIQAAAYQIILDRYVGLNKLHPRVVMVCAGNLATDRAIVNALGTAMQSRLIHLEMEINHKIFMDDVAYKHKWDSRIVSFLNYKPSYLMDFKPDHNDKTFCCPRTWEFMNKLVKGKTFDYIKAEDGSDIYSMQLKAPLYAGTITSGVATEFVTFSELSTNIPNINDILRDPHNIPLPSQDGLTHYVCMHLVEHANDKNFEPITKFINRMKATFRTIFFRSIMIRKPELRQHPEFMNALLELKKYMYET